jgi:hypothetical protein
MIRKCESSSITTATIGAIDIRQALHIDETYGRAYIVFEVPDQARTAVPVRPTIVLWKVINRVR